MSEDAYATIPEMLELRELRYAIVEKGKRTKSITVVTTLTDLNEHSKEEIAELYSYRWNSEVYQTDCTSSAGLYQLAAKFDMIKKEKRDHKNRSGGGIQEPMKSGSRIIFTGSSGAYF